MVVEVLRMIRNCAEMGLQRLQMVKVGTNSQKMWGNANGIS